MRNGLLVVGAMLLVPGIAYLTMALSTVVGKAQDWTDKDGDLDEAHGS